MSQDPAVLQILLDAGCSTNTQKSFTDHPLLHSLRVLSSNSSVHCDRFFFFFLFNSIKSNASLATLQLLFRYGSAIGCLGLRGAVGDRLRCASSPYLEFSSLFVSLS
jgi:hypothetical protein